MRISFRISLLNHGLSFSRINIVFEGSHCTVLLVINFPIIVLLLVINFTLTVLLLVINFTITVLLLVINFTIIVLLLVINFTITVLLLVIIIIMIQSNRKRTNHAQWLHVEQQLCIIIIIMTFSIRNQNSRCC
jgi:hypothetical protein